MEKKVNNYKMIFGGRLKQARRAAGFSQKTLGVAAGIDEFVASTRINRYEKGIHEADIATVYSLAQALGLPLPYFYAENDRLAELIIAFSELPPESQEIFLQILALLKENKKILLALKES